MRQAGGGRTPALPLDDRLLILLAYYRTYVPHALRGFLFGLDDGHVSRSNRRLEPLPAGVSRTPGRKVELTRAELAELFFGRTGRPAGRPVRGRRRLYSGKGRRHTLRTQVAAVRVRRRPGRGRQRRRVRTAAVSAPSPGSVHDKKVLDRAGAVTPPGATGYGDTAYLGTGPRAPRRKPPRGHLTPRQKAGDRRVGRERVAAEHGIGRPKVWRAAAERWRNPRRRHTLTVENVAGLHSRMFAE